MWFLQIPFLFTPWGKFAIWWLLRWDRLTTVDMPWTETSNSKLALKNEVQATCHEQVVLVVWPLPISEAWMLCGSAERNWDAGSVWLRKLLSESRYTIHTFKLLINPIDLYMTLVLDWKPNNPYIEENQDMKIEVKRWYQDILGAAILTDSELQATHNTLYYRCIYIYIYLKVYRSLYMYFA